ncbi:hypothetical protein AAE028_36355, partial [Sinorhizobium sp. CB9]|uniref:hypothetical protein n=1 Tax=Sinorhizobium sp. CB9 TaxID=3056948 RepID=UPI0035254928
RDPAAVRRHGEKTPAGANCRKTYLPPLINMKGCVYILASKKRVIRAVDTALLDSCDKHRKEIP